MAKRTAQTAPKGAIVIETPLGVSISSILPNIAIAANAPIYQKFLDLILRNYKHFFPPITGKHKTNLQKATERR